MTRKEKEGNHYRKRKTKEKEFYSLRSLIPEITGIEVDAVGFDAAHKTIQRIVKTFQSLDGIDKGTIKIHKNQKEGFIKATKAFYENNRYQEILSKLRNDNPLTLEEHDMLIDHFFGAMKTDLTEVEIKKIEEFIQQAKGEEFYNKRDRIEQLIIKDMLLVEEVNHYSTKLTYMDEYLKILNHILTEKAYRQLVEKRPELLQSEPLSQENLTPELFSELLLEVFQLQNDKDEDTAD